MSLRTNLKSDMAERIGDETPGGNLPSGNERIGEDGKPYQNTMEHPTDKVKRPRPRQSQILKL